MRDCEGLFIEEIRRSMEEQGVTQFRLSKRIGISESMMSLYMCRHRHMKAETAFRIAKVLRISIDTMLSRL
jgi:transcriptional regulator with XRE-family HTH domain